MDDDDPADVEFLFDGLTQPEERLPGLAAGRPAPSEQPKQPKPQQQQQQQVVPPLVSDEDDFIPHYMRPIGQAKRSFSRKAAAAPAVSERRLSSPRALPSDPLPEIQASSERQGPWGASPAPAVSTAARTAVDAVQRLLGTLQPQAKAFWGSTSKTDSEGVLKRAQQKLLDQKQLDDDYGGRIKAIRRAAEEKQALIQELSEQAQGQSAQAGLELLKRKQEVAAAADALRVEEQQLKDDLRYRKRMLQLTEDEERAHRNFALRRGVTNAAAVARKRGSQALQQEKQRPLRERLREQRAAAAQAQQKMREAGERRLRQEGLLLEVKGELSQVRQRSEMLERQISQLDEGMEGSMQRKFDLLEERLPLEQRAAELQATYEQLEQELAGCQSPHLDNDEKRAMRGIQAARVLKESKQQDGANARRVLEAKAGRRGSERADPVVLRLARDKTEFAKQAELQYRIEVAELNAEIASCRKLLADLTAQQSRIGKGGAFTGIRRGRGIGDAIQEVFEQNQRLMEQKADALLHKQQLAEEVELLKEQLRDDQELATLTTDERDALRTAEAWRRQRDLQMEQDRREQVSAELYDKKQGRTKSQISQMWIDQQQQMEASASARSPEEVAVDHQLDRMRSRNSATPAPPRRWFGGKSPQTQPMAAPKQPARQQSWVSKKGGGLSPAPAALQGGWFGKRPSGASPKSGALRPAPSPGAEQLENNELARVRGAALSGAHLGRRTSSAAIIPPEPAEEPWPKMLFVRLRQSLENARSGAPYDFDLDAERLIMLQGADDGQVSPANAGRRPVAAEEAEEESESESEQEAAVSRSANVSTRSAEDRRSEAQSSPLRKRGSFASLTHSPIRRRADGKVAFQFATQDEEYETLLLSMTHQALFGGPGTPLRATQMSQSYGGSQGATQAFVCGGSRRNELALDWKAPIEIRHVLWPSALHYYCAQRYELPQEHAENLRKIPAAQCRDAASSWGSEPEGWAQRREAVMLGALRAKFSQQVRCAEALLGTGATPLVFHAAPGDSEASLWGSNSGGENLLGAMLERIRGELVDGDLMRPPPQWSEWWPRRLRQLREAVPKLMLKERLRRAVRTAPATGPPPGELGALLARPKTGIPSCFPRRMLPHGLAARRLSRKKVKAHAAGGTPPASPSAAQLPTEG